MGPRLVFLGLLLFLGLPASPALVEAKEPAPTGSVQISTRADGKGVSATVELYVLMDMEVLTGTPQAIGSLATDMMHNALEGGGKPARKAKTDAKGKTSLSGLAKGLYAVRARGGPAKERTAWFLLPTSRSSVKLSIDLSRGPHRIRGRVVPIEDATFSGRVLLLGLAPNGSPLNVGVAHPTRPVKADGTFGFDGVPHGAYQVVAIDDERGVVMEQPCKTGAEEPVEVSIPPQKRFVISGRVRAKATGKPVAGATIGLRERLESTETTRTDAEGRFTLPSSRGARTVEITADGFATTKVNARWQLDAPKREDGSATLDASVALERAATIRGRALVARGEKPAAGARVVLMRLPNVTASDSLMPGLAMRRLLASMQVHFVVADAEGRYEAAQLQSGQYVVGSQSEAWVSENLLDLESFDDASGLLQVEPGSVHDIDVRLVPTAKIVGRVLGPDGRGMRGVPVIACSEGFGAIGGSTAATVSESGGRFTLDAIVPRHPYEVIAISRKRSPGRSKPVTLAPGEARGIELRLQEAAWLDVRATMGPKQEPRPSTFVSVGPIESSPALRHVAQQGLTDAKGHVRLGPLPRGLRMKATILDDIAGIESRELEPFEGTETTRPLHVDVGAEKMLEGRLVVPRGADPTKVHLVATDPGRLGLKDGSGKIEKDGRFRWVLFLRKRAMLRATLRHRGALYHGELEANGGSFGLTIPLHKVKPDPAEGTWLLRVKGPDGKPVPHARVTRVDRTDQVRDPSDPNSKRSTWFEHRAGQQGVVEGLAWWRKDTSAFRPPTEPADDTHMHVWFCVHGATDADGEPLPYGAAVVGPFRKRSGELEVRLPAQRVLEGTCVDAAGKPVAGVHVVAWPWHWRAGEPEGFELSRSEGGHASAKTDASGRFRLPQLGPDAYRLFVAPPTGYLYVEPIAVEAGAKRAKVTLTRGIDVQLRFLDPEGRPAARVNVSATPYEGSFADRLNRGVPPMEAMRGRGGLDPRRVHGTTNADGEVLLQGLAPGKPYNLSASLYRWEGGDVEDIRIDRWMPEAQTFRFEMDRSTVVGTTLTKDGEPYPEAIVWSYVPGRWWRVTRGPAHMMGRQRVVEMDETHEFMVVLFDKPHCWLWATSDPKAEPPEKDSARWKREVVRAEGGSRPVLKLDPGPTIRVEVPDYRPGPVPLHVLLIDPADEESNAGEHIEMTRHSTFRALDTSRRYTVYVLTGDGDRCGLRRNVRPGKTTVKIELGTAGAVRGQLTIPKGIEAHEVEVVATNQDGITLGGTIEDNGRYEITGLSAEAWRVVAWYERGDVLWIAEAEVETPRNLDLILRRDG